MIYQIESHVSQKLIDFFDKFDFIDKVVVFGSRARHDCSPKSDIDLCIYSLEMTDIEFSKLKFELDELPILYKLDIVHFEKVNKELQDNVEREGKHLFSKMVYLKDIVDLQNGYAFKSNDYVNFSNTLSCRMSSIRPNGYFDIDYNVRYLPDEFSTKYKNYLLKDNDLIIAMTDLATDPKILGIPVLVETKGKNILQNQRVGKLIFKKDNIFIPYLRRVLSTKRARDFYKQFSNGGLQINIGKKEILENKIPLPTLTKQKKIANALDKASELITLRKESIKKLDELSKSIFIDMFGDPVLNPKKWKTIKLSKLGYCKNGLNYDSKENKYKIKCLGVRDFKNLTTIDDIESLQMISVDKQPAVEYLLQNKDLVFVRSNGNKELVGRCVEVYPNEEKVTFGGFCIRFRLSSDLVIVSYLLNVLKCKSMRQKMLGRGANIQNLNQQILNGLDIPLSSITLQNKFATIIEKIEEQKALYEKELKLLEDNFNSLLQKSFS